MNFRRIVFIASILFFSNVTLAATYFSEITSTGRVKRTVVIPDAQAANGEVWTNQLLGGNWKQTFIDGSQRGAYASSGSIYDATSNTFKPFVLSIIGDSIISNMIALNVQSSLPYPFPYAQNLGVSGDKITQIQARLSSIASNVTHVILEGGTNDMLQSVDSNIIPGYTAILNSLTPTKRVILMLIPPIDEATWDPSRLQFLNNTKIASMNAQLTTLCANYTNCFMTDIKSMNMSGKTMDGLHPSASTYQEIANIILKVL